MKWQDDKAFCAWLLKVRYAEKKEDEMKPFLNLGGILYMHEAWFASKQLAEAPRPLICQCDACKKPAIDKDKLS
jgi:hypothetical protein